ncbi:MAG: hypothetical protein JJT75_01135, partial [Opitutales bacterium]|nr:hypothetical protein [Opitutales bacterium]
VPSGGAAPEGLHGSFLGEETVLDLIRDKRARIESGSFGDQALVRGPLLETFHWQRWGGHSAEDLTDSSPKLEIMLRAFPVWAEEEPQWQTVSLAGLETLAKDFSREEWDEFLKKQNKVQEWEEFLRLYQRWVAGDPAFLNQLVMLHLSYYPD